MEFADYEPLYRCLEYCFQFPLTLLTMFVQVIPITVGFCFSFIMSEMGIHQRINRTITN